MPFGYRDLLAQHGLLLGGQGRLYTLVGALHPAADRPADEPRGRGQDDISDLLSERGVEAGALPAAGRPATGTRLPGVSRWRRPGVSGRRRWRQIPWRRWRRPPRPWSRRRLCHRLPGRVLAPLGPGHGRQFLDRVHGGGAAALRAHRSYLAISHGIIV